MKKNYIAPNSKVVNIRIKANLMQASITGASGLSHTLNTGGTTESADSRGGFWDDEEDY